MDTQYFETLKNDLPCFSPSPIFVGIGMQTFCFKQFSNSSWGSICVVHLIFENVKIKALDLIGIYLVMKEN